MKILILGCGSIGKRHALSCCELKLETAVVDIDPRKSAELAREVGALALPSLQAGLEWGAKAVIVATPHIYHLENAGDVLRGGAHVLIEKPLADRLEGMEPFLDLLRQSQAKAWVVCNMRYHPAIRALRGALPLLGDVRYVRAHYGNYLPNMRPGSDYRELYCARREAGGGVILDAIHEIDYLVWFFGPVAAVQGAHGKLSDLDIDVEDFANIVLEHESGVRSVITLDYLRPFKRRGCEIIGSRGMAIWESEGKAPESCRIRLFRQDTGCWETLYETDDLDNSRPFVDLVADFISSVKGEPGNLQTVVEAADRLKISLVARACSSQPLIVPVDTAEIAP